MMVHDDYKELIPARALSALDTADDLVLREHLSTCLECCRELESWEKTAASLALSTSPVEPSPRVRERILMEIRTELKGGGSTSGKKAAEGAKVIPFAPPQKKVWYIGSFAAVAAAVLCIALLASVIVLWQQNRNARTQLNYLSEQIRSTQEQLAHSQDVWMFFSSPGTTRAELTPANSAQSAHAILAYDSSGRTVLVANGLDPVPSGKVYQLWYIFGGKPVPGKTFTIDRSGQGTLEDQLPSAAQGKAIFAITLEPEPGSMAPTSDVLLHSGS